jgi:4-hydroxy-3-polyprenylbenzoate decarboxylase
MDMNPDTPQKELIEEYLRRKQRAIKPVLVDDGPCKENIHIGNEVDLLEFPVPMVHDGDGGRYIGTWHLTITKDLDSDWVNWGMYRHMVHNKNTVALRAAPSYAHSGLMHTQKYEPKDRPMEIAIAIGTEPISTLCAASPIPYGISEVDIAGGIRGEPVEIIKCETVDLFVPATAEIVIEGEVRPHERMDEGPFGEYTGYGVTDRRPRPIIHVTAVTHRNSPILTMCSVGVPVDDCAVTGSILRGAEFLEALRARGLPVTGVCAFAETAQMLVAVAVKARYFRMADEIAHVIWASRMGVMTPYIIVVDDDVDPFNMAQVLHALATKCHPWRGIVRLEQTAGSELIPWANRRERHNLVGAKAYFDCTWPLDWDPSEVPRKCSFENIYPLEVQQKALAKWQKYGY